MHEIMNALRKIKQCGYHLDQMKKLPANEDEYMFNLVSFIGSGREVTWYLQKEFKKNLKFHDWYSNKQNQMRKDPLFKLFLEKRNVVVKETFPDIKGFTGVVRFYYTNAEGKTVMGSCWACPSIQPTDIIVPGGVITIAPDQLTAKTSVNTVLRKIDGKIESFFEDYFDKPIINLCEEYLSRLEKLCLEWEEVSSKEIA